MSNKIVDDDLYSPSRQQKAPLQSHASNTSLTKSNRMRRFHTMKIARRSTFTVVAQGLNFLKRKAPLHKLDRLARIGFPLLFVLFNCIYWYIFVIYTAD